jgi:dolichol-phosphate mannosyltransferase
MSDENTDISVVIPIFYNEPFIDELVSRLRAVLKDITQDFEIILVNDASPDKSWEVIKRIVAKDPQVTGICLSRNFGQHLAITAGVDHCSGRWLVIMDGDLQDKPEEVIKLYQKAKEGYDVVFARRRERKDGFLKKISSKFFYGILNRFTDGGADPMVANFGIYSRKVTVYFRSMRERHRLFPVFIQWLGFKTGYVQVEHGQRPDGLSAYTFSKRLKLALETIVSMSNKPLRITIKVGFVISFISFLIGAWMIVRYLMWDVPVMGWTSLIVSLYFLGGLLLSVLGILGVYMGNIFDEVKNRPLYVINEVYNTKNGKKKSRKK